MTVTDTVGLIQKLPTDLVESFNSTLGGSGGQSISHVVDAAQPEYEEQMKTVDRVLEQIGAGDIARVEVFNKMDLLAPDEAESLRLRKPDALFVSTMTGEGLEGLKDYIAPKGGRHRRDHGRRDSLQPGRPGVHGP